MAQVNQPTLHTELGTSTNTQKNETNSAKLSHNSNSTNTSLQRNCNQNFVGIRQKPTSHETPRWYQSLENKHEGKINAKELQMAFKVFQGRSYSDASCKFVVRLFDLDKNGGLDVKEFETLYFYVKQWVTAFNAFDTRRVGFLDAPDFSSALKHMDVNFSPDFIQFLVHRADPVTHKISLDQFIVTCVQIQRYTDEFKTRDARYDGSIHLRYEDFLEMVLRCA